MSKPDEPQWITDVFTATVDWFYEIIGLTEPPTKRADIRKASVKICEIPAVEQRRYCATCLAPTGSVSYPARTVQIDDDDEPNIPQRLAAIHYSRCPDHG